MNNSKFKPTAEALPSSNHEAIKRRWSTVAAATDRLARAYAELVPEDFQPTIVPPSPEVQAYEARLAAAKPDGGIKPDALAVERQAVDEALNAGSN